MRKPTTALEYELPEDIDILQAYIHKNDGRGNAGLRRIKRNLRKLTAA